MQSPQLKGSTRQWTANGCSTARKCTRSCNSAYDATHLECPHLTKAIEGYLSFKKKLLQAMGEVDPLDIL
jgi:hypothetical protein